MKAIFAWDHLSNTRFVLFILSNFLLYMWYDIPLTFLADTATGLGYTESEGARLGSAIGLLTVFGNVCEILKNLLRLMPICAILIFADNSWLHW